MPKKGTSLSHSFKPEPIVQSKKRTVFDRPFRLSKKLYRKLKTKSCTKWKGSLWEGAPDEVG